MARPFFLCLAVVLAWLAPLTEAQAMTHAYEGFGAVTQGGAGQREVHVTTLSDECTPVFDGEGNVIDCIPVEGTLRWALSDHLSFSDKGNRTVVFDVAGEIHLRQAIRVRGAFITLDCFSAPGLITLVRAGLALHGTKGAHDIIMRGCRIRDATAGSATDGITIAFGAYNIVVDRFSIWSAADELIDISADSHDVTVSWSILSGPGKNMLIKRFSPPVARVTLHHNILMDGGRNPLVAIDNAGTPATDTTLDMRNNIVWNWHNSGTVVRDGAWANIVNNYYLPPSRAITISSARAYVKGNLTGNNKNLTKKGTELTPFPAPPVETQDACAAANLVLAHAGVRPLDSIDREALSRIALGCGCGSPSLSVTPKRLSFTSPSGEPVPDQMLTVTAQGGGSVSWQALVLTTLGGSWLAVSDTTGVTPATLAVTANPAGLAQGLYEGTVIVEPDGSPNSLQVIPVSLLVGPAPAGPEILQTRVACGQDDGTESSTGTVVLSGSALPAGKGKLVAFRFTSVPIPPGAIIESALLFMYATSDRGKSIAVRYLGEAAGDSAPLKKLPADLSSRLKTEAFVDDTPAPWTPGFNPSPDLSPILQEIVSRPDWIAGNSLTLFVADDGSSQVRKIASLETAPPGLKSAILRVTYQVP